MRQAEILAVTQHTTSLQATLQRAAATAGTRETAATALTAIAEFRREAVGLRRANSGRPLQAAIDQLAQAEEACDRAVAEHEEWLNELEGASSLGALAREAEERLHAAEWTLHHRRFDTLSTRLEEAKQLAERYPVAPPSLADDDSEADLAANAVRSWEDRPVPSVPAHPTADVLRRELGALPKMPDGDLDPHESVESAGIGSTTLSDVLMTANVDVPLKLLLTSRLGGRRSNCSIWHANWT